MSDPPYHQPPAAGLPPLPHLHGALRALRLGAQLARKLAKEDQGICVILQMVHDASHLAAPHLHHACGESKKDGLVAGASVGGRVWVGRVGAGMAQGVGW